MLRHPTRRGIICLTFLLVFLAQRGIGQVVGQLRDTIAGRACAQALLSVLRPDSSLVRSTLSGRDGQFQFPGPWPAGNYILLVMHPEYRSMFHPFVVGSSGNYDFGFLRLFRKIDSMQAVTVIAGELRPQFRRDTAEFNTSHIRVNANANVEEMLGRLPGLLIDGAGNITYNGQKVQRVLVDGRELFGPDITMVTRTLNADMIARVQLIDSKTKQAQFTGVDNGQRIKTLNLVLKEDSKKGYFVKAEGGGDAQNYYHASGILGSFKGKQQLMVLGLATNTGGKGFDGATGGLGTGIYIEGNVPDALGASAGEGIPEAVGGAVHYANDWGANENQGNGYYRYGHILTRPFSKSISEQVLPDSVYTQAQQSHSVNRMTEQSFDSHFSVNLDSLSSVKLSVRGGNSSSRNIFGSNTSSHFNDTLVNDSRRTINSDVFNQDWGGDLMWRLQDRRNDNRIVSVLASISNQRNTTQGYLYSLNRFFYSNGQFQNGDTIDQRKLLTSVGANFDASLNYTEPVWKRTVLAFSYDINLANSHVEQSTFSRGDGKYDARVDSLSSYFQDNLLTQRGTFNLQGHGKSFDYVVGGDLLLFDYQERNLSDNSLSKYHYFNFAPRLNANYNPNLSVGYAISYNGTIQLPSFAQLQPIKNNNDPLHITLGNAGLRPSYSHVIDFGYHKGRSILYTFGINLGMISNSISTKTTMDNLGRQISQSVNINGSVNGRIYFSLNTKLKPLDLNLGLNNNIDYGRTVNYVNELLSKNDNYTVSTSLSLTKYVADKYNFRIFTIFSYTTTTSSINPALKIGYWSQNHIAQAGIFPWKNWEINTSCNYTWRQKTSIFDSHNSVLLWNAALNRNFLNNALTARIAINDILGQNASITRTITANQISQTTSNIIGRYWMLSILYRFTHKGGK